MTVPLSRPFVCRDGAPVVDRVDPRIFTMTYHGDCMGCGFCHDSCCQYGADIELPRVAAIDKYRAELEAYLNLPRDWWFRDDPEDFGVLDEPEYPGGKYTRTQVTELPAGRSAHNDWACVFLDPAPGGRGCRLHRFALERNIPVHDIKPMVCLLFPVSFNGGALIPAYEFTELDDEPVCRGVAGATLYRAAREDVRVYFGGELVAELDAMEKQHAPSAGDGKLVSLPVC